MRYIHCIPRVAILTLLFGSLAWVIDLDDSIAGYGSTGPGASLVGVYSQSSATQTGGSANLGDSNSIGAGALITYALGPSTLLEAGLLYAPRAITYDGTILKQRYIQVPVLLKVSPFSNFFLGVGASYDFKLRSPIYGATDDASYSAVFVDTLSAVGSAGVRIEASRSIAFILDARYAIGLTDHDSDATITRKFGQIQVLAGFGFQI